MRYSEGRGAAACTPFASMLRACHTAQRSTPIEIARPWVAVMSSHYVPNTKIPTLVFPGSAQASRHLALLIENLIRQNNAAGKPTVLGLPAGSTPVGLYRELIRL